MAKQKKEVLPAEALLSEIHRNLVLGSENLCCVVPHIKGKFMLREVTSQLEQYAAYTRAANTMMKARAIAPKKSYPLKAAMLRGNRMFHILFDHSDSHIAEMISKETRLGADQLERCVYQMRRRGCHPDVVDFGKNVVSFERAEAEHITQYR